MALTTDEGLKTFHSFKAISIDGKEINLNIYKGKKILVVNTASQCGFTPQYEQLEQLFEKYKDNNFVILGFPANNFGGQEPGNNLEIKDFCKKNYGVTFQMMEKSSVTGSDQNEIYKWLTQKTLNGVKDSEVKWNFQKYLIDENGKLVDVASSRESPVSDKIIKWIESK